MSAKLQRYVSSELSHFVGRALKTDEERYGLLLTIIGEGALVPPMLRPNPGTTVQVNNALEITHAQPLSGNEKYLPAAICFCDIPVEDLHLHVAKYSPFGLAFRKSFLIPQGANPVWYVVRQSATVGTTPQATPMPRADLFDLGERVMGTVTHDPTFRMSKPARDAADELRKQFTPTELSLTELFAHFELFSFMKFFDSNMPDDDAANFYMEREWRVIGRVVFRISDIERIFFPRQFAPRFHADVPAFAGQISFID